MMKMAGVIETPLVIGKSAKPRCFKHLNISRLPTVWRSNRKVWMTSSVLEDSLNTLNYKTKEDNRRDPVFE